MGIGIIAVGLWLLLGVQFHYNNISLFPIVVALMIICIGLLIVLNKVKQKYLIVSFILIGINLVVTLFFSNQSAIILILSLYFLFKGIDEIGYDYPKIKKYRKLYRSYLICYFIMIIFSYWIEQLLIIENILLIVSVILLVFIEYHLIKINRFLEDEFLNLNVESIWHSQKSFVILLILSCLSVAGLIYIKDDYVKTIQQEVNEEEVRYFKVDTNDYKVPPFGLDSHKNTTLFEQREVTRYSAVQVFIKDQLLENMDKVRYKIIQDDQIILESYDKFQKIEYEDKESCPFIGYTGGYINSDIYNDINKLNDSIVEKSNLVFQIQLYNQKGDCYYDQKSDIQSVKPSVMYYEDQDISIENFCYDMNTIIGLPKVYIKNNNLNIYGIQLLYGDNDFLLREYGMLDDSFDLSTSHNFIKEPVKSIKTIKVVYYDENWQVIKTTLCPMEVLS